jgi:hypothetical protein
MNDSTPPVVERNEIVPIDNGRLRIVSMMDRFMDPAIDPEKVKRAWEVIQAMCAELARQEFLGALSLAQGEFKPAKKNRQIKMAFKDPKPGQPKEQVTPYADWMAQWEGAREALSRHGLSLTHKISGGAGQTIVVTARLRHAAGHEETLDITLPHDSTGSKNQVQAIGSSIMYGRRYTGMAILNLTAEDDPDDNNGATLQNSEPVVLLSEAQIATVRKALAEVGIHEKAVADAYNVSKLEDIPAEKLGDINTRIERKKNAPVL